MCDLFTIVIKDFPIKSSYIKLIITVIIKDCEMSKQIQIQLIQLHTIFIFCFHIGLRRENRKKRELQVFKYSWNLWQNFTLYILFTVLQNKIVKVTFTFMLLFSWCAGLDHLFMHYLYSFLWERWPLLEYRYGQNTNV